MARDFDAEVKNLKSQLPASYTHDSLFKVTSRLNENYNCIAWAMNLDDVWIGNPPRLYVKFWWPLREPICSDPDVLIRAFEEVGFQKCDDDSHEDGYDKVALYQKDGEWSHAARVLSSTEYHSKLGEHCDIHHGSDADFIKEQYGEKYAYMKRKVENRELSRLKRDSMRGSVKVAGMVPKKFIIRLHS